MKLLYLILLSSLVLLLYLILISNLVFSASVSSFSYLKVINYDKHNDLLNYDGLFVYPNIIIVNGVDHNYKKILVHEVIHYNCQELFGTKDTDHTRCFTKEYNLGTSIY